MIIRKIFLLFILTMVFIGCSKPSPYQQAKELYEKSIKEYGGSFYRMPEFKAVKDGLESVNQDSLDYADAQALLEKITAEKMEARKEGVRQMLESLKKDKDLGKTKEEKPYSEMPSE